MKTKGRLVYKPESKEDCEKLHCKDCFYYLIHGVYDCHRVCSEFDD